MFSAPAHSYIGRFAPSPTGPLHFGSLVSALASFLDARAAGGRWLVRIDDIDPPREEPGAADRILRQLQQHGLQWDGDVLFQSRRVDAYRAIVDDWRAEGLAFCCQCSRKDVKAMGGIYDGRCRHRRDLGLKDNAVRALVPADTVIDVDDLFQGAQRWYLDREVGDFVIYRRDGLVAYQLAAAADEAYQGITHVVRGIDLLDSTPRQIFLLRQLGAPVPRYGHIPVALNPEGQKLSKQNRARSLDAHDPVDNLVRALLWLGIHVARDTPEAMLAAAVPQWHRSLAASAGSRPAPSGWE